MYNIHFAVVEVRSVFKDILVAMSEFQKVIIVKVPREEVVEVHNLATLFYKM